MMVEVKVVDSLTLPDMALIRIVDPKGENVDSHPLQLGKDLEIKAAATGDRATTSIFKGQIAAVEPEFGQKGCTICVRAYDKAHKLNRARKTRTFQNMSAGDMARKVASEAGLTADITSTDVVHEFFQQSNETDWDFLWRLALMHDYEVVVTDTKLSFRPANKGDGGAAVALKWQDSMISFRPRMSGVQQPQTVNVRAWDPKNKQNVNGSAQNAETSSQAGVQRSKVANDLGGGTTAVTDRVAANNGEANAIAKSTLNRLADGFYEADGVAFGNPKIKAGTKVQVSGVGPAVQRNLHRDVLHAHLPRQYRLPDRLPDLGALVAHPARVDAPGEGARLVLDARGRRGDQQQRPGPDGARAREVPLAVGHRGVGLGAHRHAERRQRARSADDAAARRGGHHRLRAR